MTSYRKLLKPGRIGKMGIRNRLVMPSMSTRINYGGKGYVTDRFKAYLEERARGGIGLIIVETNCVDGRAWRSEHQLRIDDDRFIPGLQELVEVIHRHGARAAQQLSHGGRSIGATIGSGAGGSFPEPGALQAAVMHRSTAGRQVSRTAGPVPRAHPPVGPSAIAAPGCETPHELTIAEIGELVDLYAGAANRAKRAGFDAVEIHACHTDLIKQFLAPSSNQRRDEYGGSWQNRARFLLEIVRATRKAVGPDFPFWCRIDSEESEPEDHIEPAELLALARLLQESGVDAISVSGVPYCCPYLSPPGYFVHAAAAVKQAVSIPVIVAGGISPEMAETILGQGKADFIAMGRQAIADPQYASKLAAGKREEIVPCIRCGSCTKLYYPDNPICCAVNASVGRERDYRITPAGKKKRLLVVGGGPAGMEAARVAALRGHEVTLCDRAPGPGGALPLLSLLREAQGGDLIGEVTRYFETQLRKLGVRVRWGTDVDAGLAREMTADVVIVATGGVPGAVPEIPGIDRPIVVSQARLHGMVKRYLRIFGPRVLRWLTGFYLPVGKRVVIIGGAIQGVELAEFLTRRGRKVTVAETSVELGDGIPQLSRTMLLESLSKSGCVFLTGVKYEEVTDGGLTVITAEGERRTLEADTILTALPFSPNTGLFESLKGKVPEIYLIGDASEMNLMMGAISEGFRTALTV